jgi:hypothetical protein
MSQIRHQDAITRASLLMDNGYSASYVYEKLLKEGFSEEEAKSVLDSLTDKPFKKPAVVPADSSNTPAKEEPKESTGTSFFKPQIFVLLGFLLMLIGLALFFFLPDSRIIAYIVLVAGPLMILFAALRTSS